jgi:hypothetical protein
MSWLRANVHIAPGSRDGTVQYHQEWHSGVECPMYGRENAGGWLYHTKLRAMQALVDSKATVKAGLDAIHGCTIAAWFEWPKGLVLFFWNWGLFPVREKLIVP